MTDAYPQGQDLVWIAHDNKGDVAAFITAGEGPIPKVIIDCQFLGITSCEAELLELPPSSSATILVSVVRPEAYSVFAVRGMFVYDWTDVHRTSATHIDCYEPVAIPSKPIELSALPSILRQFADLVSFQSIKFGHGVKINPISAFPCISI